MVGFKGKSKETGGSLVLRQSHRLLFDSEKVNLPSCYLNKLMAEPGYRLPGSRGVHVQMTLWPIPRGLKGWAELDDRLVFLGCPTGESSRGLWSCQCLAILFACVGFTQGVPEASNTTENGDGYLLCLGRTLGIGFLLLTTLDVWPGLWVVSS